MARVGRTLLAALVLAAALAGCSGDADTGVGDTVSQFYGALADSDAETACGLLAPATRAELESSSGKPCTEALPAEVEGSSEQPEVDSSGAAAQAHVGSDTVFLSEYDGGWLVVAAGCAPPEVEDRPYDCRVHGG